MLGSTQLNQFEGHRFQQEEDLFVRETTQNSIDNPQGDHKPRIVFRLVTLEGVKKTKFLKLTELAGLHGNEGLLKEADKDNELLTVDGAGSLSLLYIEDFNTIGLDGVIADPKSNWMRFNLHGDAQKLKEELKIGSYGYGKSVLARAAGTRSFIAYTTVKPNPTDGHRRRLMGHTFQNLFQKDGQHFSGRGWFCKDSDAKGDPVPFVDEEAGKLAQDLGFTARDVGDTGTSFMLVGTCPAKQPLSIASIRHAFETWWWPCLLDDLIDVEFWENGEQKDGPAPRMRRDLVPYIKCKASTDGGVSQDVDTTTFQPLNGKQLGKLSLTLAADETVFDARSHPKAPGPRRVARTRARGGMITEYREFGTEKRVAFVGYYHADSDIDRALKLAEPATHDEWTPVNQRLIRFPHGKETVQAVEDRTKHICYGFQRKHSAMRAPPAERLHELERILGAAFDPSAGGGRSGVQGDPKFKSLLEVEFPGSRVQAPAMKYGSSSNRIEGTMRCRLRAAGGRTRRIGIRLMLNVAEDADKSKGASLELKVTDGKTGKMLASGDRPLFVLEIKPGQAVDVKVHSESYPRHQTVLFDYGECKP